MSKFCYLKRKARSKRVIGLALYLRRVYLGAERDPKGCLTPFKSPFLYTTQKMHSITRSKGERGFQSGPVPLFRLRAPHFVDALLFSRIWLRLYIRESGSWHYAEWKRLHMELYNIRAYNIIRGDKKWIKLKLN